MAVKRKKTKSQLPISNNQSIPKFQDPIFNKPEVKSPKMGKWGWVGIIIAVLCVWWWKTNSWPIVAFVGMKPIFRFTVNQELYRQGGKATVDNIVTERLVVNEMAAKGIRVEDQDIAAKINEIKKNFTDENEFQAAVKEKGMTIKDVEKQLRIQIGIEKLLSDRVEVTASETANFVKDMGSIMTATSEEEKLKEAEKILRDQKLQTEVNIWIEEIRSKAKVWWIGKV